jgi:hypothetical protein
LRGIRNGDVTASYNNDYYADIGVTVYNTSFRIENDDGAWQEVPNLLLLFPGDSPSSKTTTLVGERAYDGLVAIAEIDWESFGTGLFKIRGIVIGGQAPPPAAPATSE